MTRRPGGRRPSRWRRVGAGSGGRRRDASARADGEPRDRWSGTGPMWERRRPGPRLSSRTIRRCASTRRSPPAPSPASRSSSSRRRAPEGEEQPLPRPRGPAPAGAHVRVGDVGRGRLDAREDDRDRLPHPRASRPRGDGALHLRRRHDRRPPRGGEPDARRGDRERARAARRPAAGSGAASCRRRAGSPTGPSSPPWCRRTTTSAWPVRAIRRRTPSRPTWRPSWPTCGTRSTPACRC